MNKQELIGKIIDLPYEAGVVVDTLKINRAGLIKLIDQLDEPQKPVVPQFVADWIDYCKKHNLTLFGCLDPEGGFESLANEIFEGDVRKCIRWCRKESNNFARAWLDGYTVEKEKQYEVILCNGQSLKTVYRQGEDRLDFEKVYGDLERFTRKQLEEDGFGWVFDCPGMEVREVEE